MLDRHSRDTVLGRTNWAVLGVDGPRINAKLDALRLNSSKREAPPVARRSRIKTLGQEVRQGLLASVSKMGLML